MARRCGERVPLEEATRRVLAHIRSRPKGTLFKMSEFAPAIWSASQFLNAQGQAAAASRIVTRMVKAGAIVWRRDSSDWGYREP